MNEELQLKLVESFEKVSDWVDSSEDFVVEQAPLVVSEIISWGFWSNLSISLLSFMVLIICLCVLKFFVIKNFHKLDEKDTSGAQAMVIFISGIFSIVGILGSTCEMIHHSYDTIFILVAPRLYVIEQISNYIK